MLKHFLPHFPLLSNTHAHSRPHWESWRPCVQLWTVCESQLKGDTLKERDGWHVGLFSIYHLWRKRPHQRQCDWFVTHTHTPTHTHSLRSSSVCTSPNHSMLCQLTKRFTGKPQKATMWQCKPIHLFSLIKLVKSENLPASWEQSDGCTSYWGPPVSKVFPPCLRIYQLASFVQEEANKRKKKLLLFEGELQDFSPLSCWNRCRELHLYFHEQNSCARLPLSIQRETGNSGKRASSGLLSSPTFHAHNKNPCKHPQ